MNIDIEEVAGYGLIIHCKESRTDCGHLIVSENEKQYVVNMEWVAASCSDYSSKIPNDLKTFKTSGEAEEFAKRWKGHPFYCKPNGQFEVIKIINKYKSIFDGYRLYSEEQAK